MGERLGVLSLSAALKKKNHQIRLIIAKRYGIKKIRRLMKDYSPNIVGYSAMTGEHLDLIPLNLALKKEFKFISVFGGPHATFFPQLINEEGIDAVCIGESELALPEFCRRIEHKEDYWRTPNFIVKHQGDIVYNRLFPLINNLDELPFPDRDLMHEADPNLLNLEYRYFSSTRGCPYHCSYCFNSKYNEMYHGLGMVLRHRSPINLINEFCEVRKHHTLKFIIIVDDTFLLKPKGWLEQFSKLYKEQVTIPFVCNIRPNVVTEEDIGLLKKAGLYLVWMGVECGDEKVSHAVLNRNITNKEILRAAQIVRKAGVKLVTQNLCGMPVPNSIEADLKTLHLNYAINPTFAWSSILYPYPGTPVEAYVKNHNYLKTDARFLETNKHASMLAFDSPVTKRKIENLHKLFGLLVRYEWLRPLRRSLCYLPLAGLYTILFYLWYGYQFHFKFYPMRSPWKRIWPYVHLFFDLIRKL